MEPGREIIGREVLDALPDGIVIATREGRIVYANRQMEELSGYSAAALVEASIETLIPAARRATHSAHRASYHAGGMPARPMGTGLLISLLRKDGTELPVDIALRPMGVAEGGTLVVAAVRDATERRTVETERRRERQRLASVVEVTQAILRGEGLQPVLQLVAESAQAIAESDLTAIALATPDASELVIEATAGAGAPSLLYMRLPVDASMAGAVLVSGRTWVSEDASREPAAYEPMVVGSHLGPTLSLPLAGSVGVLTIANLVGGRVFTEADLRVAELFASQAAVAIEYARAQDKVRRLAVLEDRERIGRELHDGVIQSLFAVGMNLQATAALSGSSDVRARVEKAIDELDGAIHDLRNYIFGLRPGLLADRQLGQAIASLAADLDEKSAVTTAVSIDDRLAARLTPIAGDIVQLFREALSNVARHADATTCRVSLSRDGDRALLLIDDDGLGMASTPLGEGQGLANLRQRAEGLGGELQIDSKAGEGTEIRIYLPITQPA